MQDDKTPNYSLPLPFVDNFLEDDALRLRDALIQVDHLLAEATAARDSLMKELTAQVDALNTLKSEQGEQSHNLSGHEETLADGSALGHAKAGTGLEATRGALSVIYGTGTNTACAGNDSRLADKRTPKAHKTSHKTGGTDALTPADIGAAAADHATPAASASQAGHVKLNNTVTSSATDEAATANAVKTAYDKAASIVPATAAPQRAGTAAVGTSAKYAREDHVHPAPAIPNNPIERVDVSQKGSSQGGIGVTGALTVANKVLGLNLALTNSNCNCNCVTNCDCNCW